VISDGLLLSRSGRKAKHHESKDMIGGHLLQLTTTSLAVANTHILCPLAPTFL
jgi:hypothetical protein